MNDITPKEASEILRHYTDLGYGIIIEGDDISKIVQALSLASKILANGIPYNPSGDAISREALKSTIIEPLNVNDAGKNDWYDGYYTAKNEDVAYINNAPPVSQINIFCENADEKAIEDMKAELQSVIEARPNEQIAWEQGFEAGLAQGKAEKRPQGEWGKWIISEIQCPNCFRYFETDYYSTKELKTCPNCGASMEGGAK